MSPMPRELPSVEAALAAIDAVRLRDADWQARALPAAAEASRAAARLLHRWPLRPGAALPGLLFAPHDGNPRHGVLLLLEPGSGALLDAIEILERQGQWVRMPQQARARALAERALPPGGCVAAAGLHSRMAGTPDRRYAFFNTLGEDAILTWVERRRDGGPLPC